MKAQKSDRSNKIIKLLKSMEHTQDQIIEVLNRIELLSLTMLNRIEGRLKDE